jgi:hypothetical protein
MENFYRSARLHWCTVIWLANNWVSIAGVLLTVWFAWRAKTAAEQARDAAKAARDRILAFDAIAALSSALAAMEELKELHRIAAWDVALRRYALLRRNLVAIENSGMVTGPQRAKLVVARLDFRSIEAEVERARASAGNEQLDAAEFNKSVSDRIDALIGIMTMIKVSGS